VSPRPAAQPPPCASCWVAAWFWQLGSQVPHRERALARSARTLRAGRGSISEHWADVRGPQPLPGKRAEGRGHGQGQPELDRKGPADPRGGTSLFLEAPAPPKRRRVWSQVCTAPPGPRGHSPVAPACPQGIREPRLSQQEAGRGRVCLKCVRRGTGLGPSFGDSSAAYRLPCDRQPQAHGGGRTRAPGGGRKHQGQQSGRETGTVVPPARGLSRGLARLGAEGPPRALPALPPGLIARVLAIAVRRPEGRLRSPARPDSRPPGGGGRKGRAGG